MALQEESFIDRQRLVLAGPSTWTDVGTLKVAHGGNLVVASDGQLTVITTSGTTKFNVK